MPPAVKLMRASLPAVKAKRGPTKIYIKMKEKLMKGNLDSSLVFKNPGERFLYWYRLTKKDRNGDTYTEVRSYKISDIKSFERLQLKYPEGHPWWRMFNISIIEPECLHNPEIEPGVNEYLQKQETARLKNVIIHYHE